MKRITGMVMTAVILSACVAFAQEIEVEVDVGDHGTVNGKEEDHQEKTADDGTYQAVIQSEKGYEIGEVKVNGEPLSEDDQKKITGNQETTLKLEGVTEEVQVSASFEKEGTAAEKVEGADSAKATTDQPDAAGDRAKTEAASELGTTEAADRGRTAEQTETTAQNTEPPAEQTVPEDTTAADKGNKDSGSHSAATGDGSMPLIPAAAFLAVLLAGIILLVRNRRTGVKR